MTNRAVIGVADWGRTKAELRRVARALDAGQRLPAADYELNFAEAGDLVAEITRERLRLLATLRAPPGRPPSMRSPSGSGAITATSIAT